jgi:folate-dependent tRNA-U54 methylase TrmFO/GidA
MVTVENIIDFYNAINKHLNEDQIYELVKFMHDNTHNFGLQVTYFYCTILKEEYFDNADRLTKIIHGGEKELREFTHDIYQYCLLKFQ